MTDIIRRRSKNRPTEFHESLAAQASDARVRSAAPTDVRLKAAVTAIFVALAFIAVLAGIRAVTNTTEGVATRPGIGATLNGDPALQRTRLADELQPTASNVQPQTGGAAIQNTSKGGDLQGTYNSAPSIR